MSEVGLFDYINSINSKKHCFDPDNYTKKNYSQWVINVAFSYFPDTILIANEANKMSGLTDEQHYEFLYSMITKGRRYTKWIKNDKDEEISKISDFYNISITEAKQVRSLISKEDLDRVINMHGEKIK